MTIRADYNGRIAEYQVMTQLTQLPEVVGKHLINDVLPDHIATIQAIVDQQVSALIAHAVAEVNNRHNQKFRKRVASIAAVKNPHNASQRVGTVYLPVNTPGSPKFQQQLVEKALTVVQRLSTFLSLSLYLM
eukprot:COSAG01_NODE_38001_length_495_cov_45.421717_1_plen_132_part_00